MRNRLTALVAALNLILPLAAFSTDYRCEGRTGRLTGPLSDEERREVFADDATDRVVIAEARARNPTVPTVRHWNMDSRPILWDEARKIVLMGSATAVFVDLHRDVLIFSRSGKYYRTVEPHAGDATQLVREVDPCHVFIELELE